MTEAELRQLHPPIRCGDGTHCNGALLEPRISETGLGQSFGWKVSAVFECKACPWKRFEPLKEGSCTRS